MKILLLFLLVSCGQLRYVIHKTYFEKCARGIAPTIGECGQDRSVKKIKKKKIVKKKFTGKFVYPHLPEDYAVSVESESHYLNSDGIAPLDLGTSVPVEDDSSTPSSPFFW